MNAPVFFEKDYAWNNNIGFVVGFQGDELLRLERDFAKGEWQLPTVNSADVRGIRVRRYRSLYVVGLAVICALAAAVVAYFGATRELIGPGIFTVPVFLGGVSYLAWGTQRIRIDFDAHVERYVYKSRPGAIRETIEIIPQLKRWADEHRIPMDIGFPID